MSLLLWVCAAVSLVCLVNARGLLIAVESFDREAGKYLSEWVNDFVNRKLRLRMVLFEFYDINTDIGRCINEYTCNRSVCNERAAHLLYSADRWDYQNTIERSLNNGANVLLDNYYYVQTAESLSKGFDMNFCVSPNAGLPKPDLVLFANWNKVGFEQKRAHIQQLLADTTMEIFENSEDPKAIAERLASLIETKLNDGCNDPIKRI